MFRRRPLRRRPLGRRRPPPGPGAPLSHRPLPSRARQALTRANRLMADGQWTEAARVFERLAEAARIWALTGGIGSLLSVVVPAGLGVRELTLTVLLSPPMSVAEAIVVAILLRILYVGGSLVWGGLLLALARLAGRRQQRGPAPEAEELNGYRRSSARGSRSRGCHQSQDLSVSHLDPKGLEDP